MQFQFKHHQTTFRVIGKILINVFLNKKNVHRYKRTFKNVTRNFFLNVKNVYYSRVFERKFIP